MSHWLIHALDPVRAMCGDWCLHFWEVVGVWFTGLATFAAVILSLALARREGFRLTVSAGHRLMVGGGQGPPFPELLAITVRNFGSRRTTIEGVGWRRRPWQRLHGYQTFNMANALGPPATIEPGEAKTFWLPLSAEWAKDFVKDFVGRRPKVGVHLVRIIAWMPSGTRCSAFLEPSLKQWLLAKAKTLNTPPAAPQANG